MHVGIARWLDVIPGSQHLQKAVILGSVGIFRKILSTQLAMMILIHQKQGWLSNRPYGPTCRLIWLSTCTYTYTHIYTYIILADVCPFFERAMSKSYFVADVCLPRDVDFPFGIEYATSMLLVQYVYIYVSSIPPRLPVLRTCDAEHTAHVNLKPFLFLEDICLPVDGCYLFGICQTHLASFTPHCGTCFIILARLFEEILQHSWIFGR